MERPRCDVVVVGGGVIGLASAWRAAREGLAVVLVDPEPGRGASWAAAGMLAPVTEVHYGEEALLALNLASARSWPGFAAEVEEESGLPVSYRRTGTLLVAADEGDRAWAAELHRFQAGLGLEVEWLTGREARALEPALAPGVRAGLWAPGDHQVHNRELVGALLAAGRAREVVHLPLRVSSVETSGGAVSGVGLGDGTTIDCGAVVLAAGCRSGELAGVPAGVLPPVRPVKGQILRLRGPADRPLLSRTVRGVVQGQSVYLVPRADGSLVIGATVEEAGFDLTVTAGAVYGLLRDAQRVVPGVSELVLEESLAGLRPGSPDNGPLVGPSGLPGLVLATGHYRNGILLTPLTAEAVAATLAGREVPGELAGFGPDRFPVLAC